MRNYVIINGVNSNTITGLAINELPPITKPPLRTLIEEIDGRDGDLITDLGYGAYDKVMTIGLYHTFDIDQIIAFFNGSGTIVFSNEPDKKYNFKIIEQIDYESLIKFKTASITLHCQPFKYPLSETPIIAQYDYVTGTGTTLTLNNTKQAPMVLEYKGNTYQDSTSISGGDEYDSPSPDHPQVIHSVTGDNDINVCGKNRIDNTNLSYNYSNVSSNLNQLTTINTGIRYETTSSGSPFIIFKLLNLSQYIGKVIRLKANFGNNGEIRIVRTNNDCSLRQIETQSGISGDIISYTVPNDLGDKEYLAFGLAVIDGNSSVDFTNLVLTIDDEDMTYQPYQSQNYEINLPVENLYTYGDLSLSSTYYFVSKHLLNNFENGATYTIDFDIEASITPFNVSIGYGSTDFQADGATLGNQTNGHITYTFTAYTQYYDSNNYKNLYIRIPRYSTSGTSWTASVTNIKLGKGKATNIGGETIELNKIGNYQDSIFYNTTDTNLDLNSWYIKKEIGSVTLDGSEDWYVNGTGTANWFYYVTIAGLNIITDSTATNSLCDHYIYASVGGQTTDKGYYIVKEQSRIRIRYGTEDTTTNYKNWLSSNNVTFKYVLATPTYTKITDSTLLGQLNAIKHSYDNQTNISQTNNDEPFILTVTAETTNSGIAIVNNTGNIYSKPKIDIEGNGNVYVSLNGNQLFSVNVNEEVIIDSTNLEAYKPDGTLQNRQVTGNIANLKLNTGNNTLEFSGGFEKATITDYVRYL